MGALASRISQLEVKSYLDAQSEESDRLPGESRGPRTKVKILSPGPT